MAVNKSFDDFFDLTDSRLQSAVLKVASGLSARNPRYTIYEIIWVLNIFFFKKTLITHSLLNTTLWEIKCWFFWVTNINSVCMSPFPLYFNCLNFKFYEYNPLSLWNIDLCLKPLSSFWKSFWSTTNLIFIEIKH